MTDHGSTLATDSFTVRGPLRLAVPDIFTPLDVAVTADGPEAADGPDAAAPEAADAPEAAVGPDALATGWAVLCEPLAVVWVPLVFMTDVWAAVPVGADKLDAVPADSDADEAEAPLELEPAFAADSLGLPVEPPVLSFFPPMRTPFDVE